MPGDMAFGELLALSVYFAAGGAITGILAGVFGIGGGTVIVPVLYQLFGLMGVPESVRMHLCIGTSLAAIIPTSLRSYRAHEARGAVDPKVIRQWAVPVMIGAVLGAVIAAFVSSGQLRGIFAGICTFNGLRFVFGKEHWRLADDLPGPIAMAAYGIGIGVFSALMGISGGQLIIMIMTLYNRPIHQAVATSAGLGVLTSIPGAIGYVLTGLPEQGLLPPLSIGYVSLIGAALLAPISVWTAPVGVRLAHGISRRTLELVFGIYLLAIAGRFFWSILH
ncbi:sulfite exporter TauE/SafE family protein [Microvirga massiliensis]|uniref:sulfite exporter TauE/SafE family protein n=1 Tax=Microvirga massiliensis TaxID=1033741 RepID=UPI00062B8EA5|nr:sulfite exporter TauE/SafE family protein [Microvirga massiliensis]